MNDTTNPEEPKKAKYMTLQEMVDELSETNRRLISDLAAEHVKNASLQIDNHQLETRLGILERDKSKSTPAEWWAVASVSDIIKRLVRIEAEQLAPKIDTWVLGSGLLEDMDKEVAQLRSELGAALMAADTEPPIASIDISGPKAPSNAPFGSWKSSRWASPRRLAKGRITLTPARSMETATNRRLE